MRVLVRPLVLGVCTGVAIACGSSTEPSAPATANSRFPVLLNAGGPVLSPMRPVAVVASGDSLRDSLFAFAKALPVSHWWPEVATPYGISPTATAFTVAGPPIASGTQLTLADISDYVQRTAIDSAGYRADGHTVFLVFVPTGVSCIPAPNGCPASPAFHRPFGKADAVAVVTRNQADFHSMMEAMTIAASHEIVESATDPEINAWILVSPSLPWIGSPWALDDGGRSEENADICGVGTRYLDGGFYYQRIFSNQAAALAGDPCVPAIAEPYFNIATDKGWYATSTGEVTVPLTGWSVGAVPEWEMTVVPGLQTPSLAKPRLSLSCPDTVAVGSIQFCALNSGDTVMMHITLPAGARSQSFFSIVVNSLRIDSKGLRAGPGEDYGHHSIFGVYVP
jgi:hypothetical protein